MKKKLRPASYKNKHVLDWNDAMEVLVQTCRRLHANLCI